MFKTYVLNDCIDKSIEKSEKILKSAVDKGAVKARIISSRGSKTHKTRLIRLKTFDQDELISMKAQLLKKYGSNDPDSIQLEIAPLTIVGFKFTELPTNLDEAFNSAAGILKKKKNATKVKVSVRIGNNVEDSSEIYLRKYDQEKLTSLRTEIIAKFNNSKSFDQILLLTSNIGERIIKCPNCQKEMQSNNLSRHLKGCVTGNFCPICQREVLDGIKEHVASCNRVFYSCRVCGESFSTGSKRAAHEKHCQVASSSTVKKNTTPKIDNSVTAIAGTFRVTTIIPKIESTDYEGVLEDEIQHICDILKLYLEMETGLKCYISMELKMSRINDSESKKLVTFQSSSLTILKGESIQEVVMKHAIILVEKIEMYLKNGSGWLVNKIEVIKLMTSKYNPMGGSYIKVPKSIRNKKSLLNITNKDNKCFLWCCLADLHPEIRDHRSAKTMV